MGWLLIGPEWYANVSGVNPRLLRLLLERPTRISPECITRELQEPATGSGQRLRRKRICLESITRELQEPATGSGQRLRLNLNKSQKSNAKSSRSAGWVLHSIPVAGGFPVHPVYLSIRPLLILNT